MKDRHRPFARPGLRWTKDELILRLRNRLTDSDRPGRAVAEVRLEPNRRAESVDLADGLT